MRGISSGWERAASVACKAVRSPHSLPKARWDTTPVEASSATPPAANCSAEAMAHGVGSSSTRSAPQRTAISPTGVLVHHGGVAPLDEVAAHGAYKGGIVLPPQALQHPGVAQMKGIVFAYDTNGVHDFPLKILQKVTIQLRDTRICGNFSNFGGYINDFVDIYEILSALYHTSADFATAPGALHFSGGVIQ